MGFKAPRPSVSLTFEGHPDLDGLEMRISSLSVDELIDVSALVDQLKAKGTTEALPELRKMLGFLAAAIREWNLEDEDGKPVPATAEGLGSLDLGFIMTLMDAWTGAMASVEPPLPGSSNGTHPSPPSDLELSLPMETLQPSRSS